MHANIVLGVVPRHHVADDVHVGGDVRRLVGALEHVRLAQCREHVVALHAGALAQCVGRCAGAGREERAEHGDAPVAVVCEVAEVGERFLWRAAAALALREQVAHLDQKVAPAAALVDRQRHDAAHVVVHWAQLLLAKVADKVGAVRVGLGEDVEEERLDVVAQRLVVEEELGEEAQVLAVDLVLAAVDLEHGHAAAPVDLLAGRAVHDALGPVTHRHEPALHVLEAELAQPQAAVGHDRVLLRERRLEPCVDIVRAKADHAHGQRLAGACARGLDRKRVGRRVRADGRGSVAELPLGGAPAPLEARLVFGCRHVGGRVGVVALEEPGERCLVRGCWRRWSLVAGGSGRRRHRGPARAACGALRRHAEAHNVRALVAARALGRCTRRGRRRRVFGCARGALVGSLAQRAEPEAARRLVAWRRQAVQVPPAVAPVAEHDLLVVAFLATHFADLAFHAAPRVCADGRELAPRDVPLHAGGMSCVSLRTRHVPQLPHTVHWTSASGCPVNALRSVVPRQNAQSGTGDARAARRLRAPRSMPTAFATPRLRRPAAVLSSLGVSARSALALIWQDRNPRRVAD